MVISYANINTTESLGTSVQTVIKGSAQFVSASIDSALGSSSGAIDMVVIAGVLMVLAIAIGYAAKAVHAGKRIVE